MFISEAAARSIVREIKEITGRDINIMDENGVIFASTDPERVGQRHPGACRVLEQGLPSLTVQEDDPHPGGARRGVNLPIQLEEHTVGVIGITGPPAQVEGLGTVIKRMTEIMVRDIRRQEQEDLLDSARQCFIENWLFAEEPDLAELELRGNMLGIDLSARWTVVILAVRNHQAQETPQEMRNALYVKHIRPLSGGGVQQPVHRDQPADTAAVPGPEPLCGAHPGQPDPGGAGERLRRPGIRRHERRGTPGAGGAPVLSGGQDRLPHRRVLRRKGAVLR